jgi:hypothetical protein
VVDRPLDAVVSSPSSDLLVGEPPLLFPLALDVSPVAAMLNTELADDAVYDGFELQRFDDEVHGRGVLAFLTRREDRTVDYYVDPDLRVDRASYHLGGGTGRWVECEELRDAVLEVTDLGVHADVRFTDLDGREVELRVDDRLAGRRRPGVLLAPVGAGIEHPLSLLLVYLHGFDLVRRVSPDPLIRIDGHIVSTGRLPGAAVHRRHLIKYAGPLAVANLCRAVDGPLAAVAAEDPGDTGLDPTGRAVTGVRVRSGPARAELVLEPPFPSLTDLTVGRLRTGLWHVNLDGVTLTGGTWKALRRSDRVEVGLDVTRRWDPPRGLPWLYALVTRVLPTFRRWPTTYRWRAEVTLPDPASGAPAHLTSRWERTGEELGSAYRRATRS